MSGGKKKSGPKHWLHSAKSIFKGHSKSSSSHSGVNTSGASSPGASIAPGSVVSLPSGSSQGGSNSLIPTGSAIVSGGSPVAPGQHRSRQNQPTVAGNSRTNPQANLTPAPAPAPAPALTPTPTSAPPPPDPNKDIVASIHVTITEIKTAQKALDDKKWYYTDRHGRQVDIGERMRRIVMSMEKCAKIVDVAIQHHPEISSLVWAGARFILMVAVNRIEFMDSLEAAMVTIVEKMARCEFYAHIYDKALRVKLATSTTTQALDDGLDGALKDLYASVRAFLDKAKEYFDPANNGKKIVNDIKPFSVTMQPLIQDISDKETKIEQYAGMATMERIRGDSSRLREVHDLVTQIGNEMKPLAKMDDILTATTEILTATQDLKNTMATNSAQILNANNDVKQTLVELKTQVVQSLQPQQLAMLSSKSLDSELQELKTKYLAESQQTDIFHANLYVAARGMATQNAPEEEHFDLWERLENFMALNTPHRVCLIQGAAGAGKSTFNHYLATRLWETYDKDASSNANVTRPIPVFIPLASVHDATRRKQDLIAELFKKQKWPEDRIAKAREDLRFVFILDGYDEIEKRDRDFYVDNGLGEWNAKIVITSRPEYLGSGYQRKFYPPGQPQLLQEYWLAPFSTKDIMEYISKYVQVVTAPARSVKDYEQLVQRAELRAMISNPFLLRMVMTVLPTSGTGEIHIELKRVTLYRRFLDHWLQSAQERLSRIQLPSALADLFIALCESSFTEHVEVYCLDFAVELYRHKSLEASYVPATRRSASKQLQNALWRDYLSPEDPKVRLLRYSSPLVRIGESYRFLHKSLRDFAIAHSMWQDEDLCAPSALLNEFHIVHDHGVIDFIVEEAEQNQELQDQLLACVEESKQNPEIANAAANAITILVRAGRRFHKYDLQGIRIAGADIGTGWFEGAQLQSADLRRVRLDGIWLRGADLTGARIDGGEFGEKPYFNLDASNRPLTCWYTSGGELLVAAYRASMNNLTLWSATKRKLLHTFSGHTDLITCVAFPANGDHELLVSGSRDKTLRLWSRRNQNAQLVHTFDGHTTWVESVAISPDARFLASGGNDSMVYLWSVATHDLIHNFSCDGQVSSLSFSPDSQTLASAGDNKQVNLWSTESGKLLQTLEGHTEEVNSVTFSPNGQILASTSSDESLKLWLVSSGQLIYTFNGHSDRVHAAIFAPDGQMIASASDDSSIRIWSVASQKLIHVIEGISLSHYIYGGSALAFSRDGQLIATGDATGVVRQSQWLVPSDPEMSTSVQFGNRHTTTVNDLAFSHDKKLLASASDDGTVHLWSVDPPHMPDRVNTLDPPSARSVVAVAFPPDSAFLASAFLLPSVDSSKVCTHRSFLDKSQEDMHILGTHPGWVRTAALTPDGTILASGGKDKDICLWSIHSGTQIDTLKGHKDSVESVDFSPDGQLLVSGAGSNDKTVILWSVPRRTILHIYKGHWAVVNHVAFSPDGEVIASASYDKSVRLWSVTETDRKCLHIFEGHINNVKCLAFSPDGYLLASGSADKTLRFWSLSSRELVLNIEIQGEVCALAWTGGTSAECGLIAIGTETGGVQLLQVVQKQGYSRESPLVELSWIWATDHGVFANVSGARLDGVRGLNHTNIELLKQRGAIGEPVVDRVQEVEEAE